MASAETRIRPIPSEVRGQLDKLMLMLGSDHVGESGTAASLITALLKRNGLDWHDVVGSIGKPQVAPPPPPKPKPKSRPPNQKYMTATELRELVRLIMRSPVNEQSRQFLAGMLDRADVYGEVLFSDKQWIWIRDLARRAGAI